MKGAKGKVKTPADIPDEITKQIQDMVVNIYTQLHCTGGAPRIDFLYNKVAHKLYINEINVTPGAMQMHLWKESGYSIKEFVENLVSTALRRLENSNKEINFNSNILDFTIQSLEQHA